MEPDGGSSDRLVVLLGCPELAVGYRALGGDCLVVAIDSSGVGRPCKAGRSGGALESGLVPSGFSGSGLGMRGSGQLPQSRSDGVLVLPCLFWSCALALSADGGRTHDGVIGVGRLGNTGGACNYNYR